MVDPAQSPDDPVLRGATPEHSGWLNLVPEPHTAKDRVHLRVPSLASPGELEQLTEPARFAWTVRRAATNSARSRTKGSGSLG